MLYIVDMAIYGYCRATTPKQALKAQEKKIKNIYSEAVIFSDSYSGIQQTQPEFDRLKSIIAPGDLLVITDITKLSEDAVSEYMELYSAGIRIEVLDNPLISSDVYSEDKESIIRKQIELSNKMELARIYEDARRILNGIERAKAEGVHIGRPPGTKYETKRAIELKLKIWELSKDFQGTLSDPELLELIGIARNTFYKYKKDLRLYGIDRPSWSKDRRKKK